MSEASKITPKQNNFGKRFYRLMLAFIVLYFISYFFNIVLARVMSPEDYGDVALVFKLISFSVPLLLIGTNFSSLKFISEYMENSHVDKLSRFYHWLIRIIVIACLLCVLIGVLCYILFYILHARNIYSFDNYHPLILIFWLLPLFALIVIQTSILQSFKVFTLSIVLMQGLYLLVIVIILLAGVRFEHLSAFTVLGIFGFASMLILPLQYILILKKRKHKVELKPADSKLSKIWKKTSIRMLSVNILFLGLASIDMAMFEVLSNKEHQLGMLASIFIILKIFTSLNGVGDTILSPYVSSLISNKPALQELLMKINIYKIIPAIGLVLVILFFGKNILAHFYPSFTVAYVPLCLICCGYFLNVCFDSASNVLIFSGNESIAIKISVFLILLNLILNLILIPRFHILGVSITILITLAMSSVLNTYFTYKRTGIVTPFGRLIR